MESPRIYFDVIANPSSRRRQAGKTGMLLRVKALESSSREKDREIRKLKAEVFKWKEKLERLQKVHRKEMLRAENRETKYRVQRSELCLEREECESLLTKQVDRCKFLKKELVLAKLRVAKLKVENQLVLEQLQWEERKHRVN